ncbi:adenylate/guanylate cyclase domain-containing protein [Yinghuangia aomiensis]
MLFVAFKPDSAVELGLRMVEVMREQGMMPELRVGIAYGQVLSRMGDVFGTTVNLASRLTALAPKNTVVIDRDLAAALGDDPAFDLQPMWRRPCAASAWSNPGRSSATRKPPSTPATTSRPYRTRQARWPDPGDHRQPPTSTGPCRPHRRGRLPCGAGHRRSRSTGVLAPAPGAAAPRGAPAVSDPPDPGVPHHPHVSPLRHPDPRVASPVGLGPGRSVGGGGRTSARAVRTFTSCLEMSGRSATVQTRGVAKSAPTDRTEGVRCQQRGGRVPGDAGCRRKRCPPAPRHGREVSEGDSGYARGMCSCCDAALTLCALFLLRKPANSDIP